jgi:hypothetical protein
MSEEACYVEACHHPAPYLDGTSCVCHLTLEEVDEIFQDRLEAVVKIMAESEEFRAWLRKGLEEDDVPDS